MGAESQEVRLVVPLHVRKIAAVESFWHRIRLRRRARTRLGGFISNRFRSNLTASLRLAGQASRLSLREPCRIGKRQRHVSCVALEPVAFPLPRASAKPNQTNRLHTLYVHYRTDKMFHVEH